jgi:hypothetical protein
VGGDIVFEAVGDVEGQGGEEEFREFLPGFAVGAGVGGARGEAGGDAPDDGAGDGGDTGLGRGEDLPEEGPESEEGVPDEVGRVWGGETEFGADVVDVVGGKERLGGEVVALSEGAEEGVEGGRGGVGDVKWHGPPLALRRFAAHSKGGPW